MDEKIAEDLSFLKPKLKQLTLKEYYALKEQESKKSKSGIPKALQIFLAIPFLLVFCFGLYFIPWMIVRSLFEEYNSATAQKVYVESAAQAILRANR